MPYFRKKPVVVEAIYYDGENDKEIQSWSRGVVEIAGGIETHRAMRVHTLEGAIWLSVGDWIIRGIKGEYYPCKPDIFKETYEQVSGIYADEPT